jgi:hypothetical protein
VVLNVLGGKVIGTCFPRHWNIEFQDFLRQINRESASGLAIHVVSTTTEHTNTSRSKVGRKSISIFALPDKIVLVEHGGEMVRRDQTQAYP